MEVDFDPAPTAVQIYRCECVCHCRVRRCLRRATLIRRKLDCAGRTIRQIELCEPRADVVIALERMRCLEIHDRRHRRYTLAGGSSTSILIPDVTEIAPYHLYEHAQPAR